MSHVSKLGWSQRFLAPVLFVYSVACDRGKKQQQSSIGNLLCSGVWRGFFYDWWSGAHSKLVKVELKCFKYYTQFIWYIWGTPPVRVGTFSFMFLYDTVDLVSDLPSLILSKIYSGVRVAGLTFSAHHGLYAKPSQPKSPSEVTLKDDGTYEIPVAH